MKNTLIFGDVHLDGSGFDKLFIENILLKSLKYIWKNEYRLENIIFLGDIIDNPSKINLNVLSSLTEIFRILSEYNIYILIGNHDLYKGNDIFTNIPLPKHVKIIRNIEDIKNNIFIPYYEIYPNKEEIDLVINDLINKLNDEKNINAINIFSHNTYSEQLLNDFLIQKMNAYSIVGIYKDLTKVDNKKVNIFTGHIHKPIVIKNIYDNVDFYNLGCAIPRSFNDNDIDFVITAYINENNEIGIIKIEDGFYKFKILEINEYNWFDIFKIIDDDVNNKDNKTIFKLLIDKENTNTEIINDIITKINKINKAHSKLFNKYHKIHFDFKLPKNTTNLIDLNQVFNNINKQINENLNNDENLNIPYNKKHIFSNIISMINTDKLKKEEFMEFYKKYSEKILGTEK